MRLAFKKSLHERSLDIGRALKSINIIQSSVDCRATVEPGADAVGGAPGAPPPQNWKQNMIFLHKIVIFHTKHPTILLSAPPIL